MDHPESQTAGVLQTLKLFLTDPDELINILPTLEICFKSEENEENLPEIISVILGAAAQVLSLPELERAILHPFLPLVKQFMSKTLSAIYNVLSKNIQEDIIVTKIKQHLELGEYSPYQHQAFSLVKPLRGDMKEVLSQLVLRSIQTYSKKWLIFCPVSVCDSALQNKLLLVITSSTLSDDPVSLLWEEIVDLVLLHRWHWHFTGQAKVCIQVLIDLDSLLSYVSDSNDVTVTSVLSMPKNVAEITHEVFTHCQKSKEDYREVFSPLHTDLASLFQKCQKVHLNLLTILKEKLYFDCSCQDEFELLICVLDVLSSMAEYLIDLDTMTLVTHWKAYAWLTQTYAGDLCSRLEVSSSVSCLTRSICGQLSNLADIVSDKKLLTRTVKVTGLFVKVLIKLCENYKGYLGDCHKELLDCLISLSGYTGHLFSQQGVPTELVTHITTQALAGAAPLLSHLILDPLFVKVFFGFADELQSSPCIVLAGYSNLLVLVLKKLVQLSSKDDEIQDIWLETDLPLVRTVFKVVQESCPSGEIFHAYEDDIYAHLLGHTAAFILATCTDNMFPHLERLIMEHLLQPLLFPALFSSDLLCLVARLGSSELCLQLAELLNEVLACWPSWDWHRPEWVYVSWTLSRLILLLSTNHLQIFQARLPSQTVLATELCTFLDTSLSNDSVSQLKSIIERLNLIEDSKLSPDTDSAFADALQQLWQHAAVLLIDDSIESSQWFLGLYSALVEATCCSVDSFSNAQIIYILDVLTKACKVNTTLISFVACEFLRVLAKRVFTNDSNQSIVCCRISLLFKQLLESENLLTKQIALEVFSYFAHLTQHEQIVPETVANNHQLQVLITDYFQCVPAASSGTSFLEHLQSLQPTFQHKCKVKSKTVRLELDDVEQNPCKKLKPSLSEGLVCAALGRIENDLDMLEKYLNSEAISHSVSSKVQNIVIKFNRCAKKC